MGSVYEVGVRLPYLVKLVSLLFLSALLGPAWADVGVRVFNISSATIYCNLNILPLAVSSQTWHYNDHSPQVDTAKQPASHSAALLSQPCLHAQAVPIFFS